MWQRSEKTWQLVLGLMRKNKSRVMPVWIYFSFLMAPADVWGILDFLSTSVAQLAPLGWVLAVGDVCVVYLHFDLRTLQTLDRELFSPFSCTVLTPSHRIRFIAVAVPSPASHASTLRGFGFQWNSQHLSLFVENISSSIRNPQARGNERI